MLVNCKTETFILFRYLISEASSGQTSSNDGESNKRKHEEDADTRNEGGNKRAGKKERKRGQNKVRNIFNHKIDLPTFALPL